MAEFVLNLFVVNDEEGSDWCDTAQDITAIDFGFVGISASAMSLTFTSIAVHCATYLGKHLLELPKMDIDMAPMNSSFEGLERVNELCAWAD